MNKASFYPFGSNWLANLVAFNSPHSATVVLLIFWYAAWEGKDISKIPGQLEIYQPTGTSPKTKIH